MCAHCWHPTHAPTLAGDTVVCCLCHVRERPTGPRELAALDHCWGAREVEADLRAIAVMGATDAYIDDLRRRAQVVAALRRERDADTQSFGASEMEQDAADTKAMTEARHQILEAHAPALLAQIQVGAPPVGT